MKTREEKIAELNEGDRVALEHYELHPKHNPWGNPNDPISKLWELGKKIAESFKPEIWEPKGGDYFVDSVGAVQQSVSLDEYRLAGIEAENEEKAQRKAALRIEREIINALIRKKNKEDGFVADWSDLTQSKWYIFYDQHIKKYDKWAYFRSEQIGAESCSLESAIEICEMLNNNLVRV